MLAGSGCRTATYSLGAGRLRFLCALAQPMLINGTSFSDTDEEKRQAEGLKLQGWPRR